MTVFRTKRIYDAVDPSDGYRVLVDRLWPRGVSKERAALDEWAKELAPSTELRTWFAHDPAKFPEFTKRYNNELDENSQTSVEIQHWQTHDVVMLLYGAKDEAHNEAHVLAARCMEAE